MTDEDRHADEVTIAFQMGAEWQKKQSDSAWKGIHEGAVLAMQARIKKLERELEQEKQSREVAAEKAWEFASRIENLEAMLREIAILNNRRDRFSFEIDTIIINALEGKNDANA
jgi:DNA polymerase II small subunit/DNA polymerase delta subunit B